MKEQQVHTLGSEVIVMGAHVEQQNKVNRIAGKIQQALTCIRRYIPRYCQVHD